MLEPKDLGPNLKETIKYVLNISYIIETRYGVGCGVACLEGSCNSGEVWGEVNGIELDARIVAAWAWWRSDRLGLAEHVWKESLGCMRRLFETS